MDNPDTDNSGHNMTQDEDNPETLATVGTQDKDNPETLTTVGTHNTGRRQSRDTDNSEHT
jgi:hypothetical protein